MRSNESNKNNKKVILQGSDLVIKMSDIQLDSQPIFTRMLLLANYIISHLIIYYFS